MKTVLAIRHVGRLAAGCVLCLAVVAVTAQGAPVSAGGAMFVQTSPVYLGPIPPSTPGIWDVNTLLNSGSIKKAEGVAGNQFRINANEVAIAWSGNQLDQDLSTMMDPDSWLAEATFLGGGTLTLTGKIRYTAIPYTVLHDGEVLTATVTGFHLRETDKDSNIINSIDTTIRFTPTGGYLYDNPYVNLRGMYDFALVGAVVGPAEGGPLDDFQKDLVSRQAFMINFNLVPEPASLLLLALGACVMGGRRGRGVRS